MIDAINRRIAELWLDERGTIGFSSMIIGTVIVTIGTLVGLATLRDHVAQQFGDTAVALDALDQSWSYENGIDRNGDGDFTDPGECEFRGEFVDSSTLSDPAGAAPAGMVFGP